MSATMTMPEIVAYVRDKGADADQLLHWFPELSPTERIKAARNAATLYEAAAKVLDEFTRRVPPVPLDACTWCKHNEAGVDGFCSRMCRVESWKANGDDTEFRA